MYVLGIHGAGNAPVHAAVVDRVVETLSQAGRVGVIRYDATIADGTASTVTTGGDVSYELGADGDWVANGTGMDVDDALEALAPDYDYAVVVGVDGLEYPSLVVGRDERDREGPVLAAVDRPSGLAEVDLVSKLESTEPYETLESLIAAIEDEPGAAQSGAIATFTGRVRAKDGPNDERTEFLEFETYEGVAEARMDAIRSDLEAREGVHAVALHHRTGVVAAGEDIVFVVVLAGHREEAFRTVEDGINRLKDEVPLFKKEVTVDEEFWVHQR
ncbi:molybdopterin synthase [Halobacteria archaeon AArc-dxtr1]|nr:molybdopterin synthase [Halobacteria archaeon AArc-dxtr1]